MEPEQKCISCKIRLVNNKGSVSFPCPKCGKYTINRCKNCRQIAAKYECPECGFIGPN